MSEQVLNEYSEQVYTSRVDRLILIVEGGSDQDSEQEAAFRGLVAQWLRMLGDAPAQRVGDETV